MSKLWGIFGFNRMALMSPDEPTAAPVVVDPVKPADPVKVADPVAVDPVKAEADRVKALTDARTANAPKDATYKDFKHAEGIAADPEAVKLFSAEAAKLGLSQAEAQSLVDMQEKIEVGRANAEKAAWAKVIEGWKNALTADKEFGGDKVEATKASARDFALKIGGKTLVDTIDALNLSDNPPLVLAFAKASKLFAEAKIDPATLQAPGSGGVKFGDASFYDHSQPKS